MPMNRYILTMLFLVCSLAGSAQKGKTAQAMARQGLVNVQTVAPDIEVRLMYARPDNFTGRILYTDLREAFLHPEAAKALAKAQKRLKALRPDLSLVVFDATRPMHIQQLMWDCVKNTPHDFYVSNPAHGGGLHNYGLAVDISLCHNHGDTLTMGTRVDAMTVLSHIDKEDALVAGKKLSAEAVANRRLLRRVMREAGFKPLRTEWWHFNFKSRAEAKRRYKLVP